MCSPTRHSFAVALAAALACLLVACASDADDASIAASGAPDGKNDDTSSAATLFWNADYQEVQSAPIVSGRSLTIRYALDRITHCRGSSAGRDVWGVTGFYSVDGDEPSSFAVSEIRDGRTVPVDARIIVPSGREIAFWFQATNRWGCVAYDSDFGANYRYPIDSNVGGFVEIEFAADGSWSTIGGPLSGGSDVVVRYALDRLPTCRGTSRGYPQWSIVGFYAVDDDEPTSFEVSRPEGTERTPVEATFTVRAGDSLALWFRNTNRWGCIGWDSQDGANYVLPMSQ